MKRPSVKLFSDNSLLYEWADDISEELFEAVWTWSHFLKQQLGPFIEEIVPAYASLAVFLKPSAQVSDFINLVDIANIDHIEVPDSGRRITIPVCYESPYGEDISQVANICGLNIPDVIELHTRTDYLIHFIGFLPGFPYLGGLDPRLHLPRRNSPRRLVERGSVAIGGGQTGIYPLGSPGGWHILGRTPLRLFDFQKEPVVLLQSGDRVRFKAISKNQYGRIASQIASGTYHLKIDTK